MPSAWSFIRPVRGLSGPGVRPRLLRLSAGKPSPSVCLLMKPMTRLCAGQRIARYGQESGALVRRLRRHNLTVIKALFHTRAPFFKEAAAYDASAFLFECGRGRLPGGNAAAWQWQSARNIERRKPVILAGGLTAANVSSAIHRGSPDAVDVSSGVESTPGRKQPTKVKSFINAVCASGNQTKTRRIF